ncbi:MAG: CotH kinase family protein [Spirochaetaceae bacterium]|jgi:hypothetical protein|nr:CotH kinase family protein [Spirochaetaceae bacterium]
MNKLSLAFLLGIFLLGCDWNYINWDKPAGYVDPATLNTGLPIVRIDTAEGRNITSRKDYLPAEITITDAVHHEYDLTAAAEVRGRGNATWVHFAKKPYRIKFDKKQKLFNIDDKAKSWVLLACAGDETLIRDTLAFELGRRFGLPFTNHYVPVELVLNGEYRGSYLLTEQMQTGAGRVDIDEDAGWLVELDNGFDEEPKFRTNLIPFPVMIKTPETILNGVSDNFVKQDMNNFIGALFADSFPDNGYRDLINMDTFVDYIMIQEFMKNSDFWSLRSVYMYKDAGGPICMGPLWDFENTLKDSPDERRPDSGEDYTQLGELLWGRFFEDPLFRARYKERWATHHSAITEMAEMDGFIDDMKTKLSQSYRTDYYLWHGTYPSEDAYSARLDAVKAWWDARITYMNGVIQP